MSTTYYYLCEVCGNRFQILPTVFRKCNVCNSNKQIILKVENEKGEK